MPELTERLPLAQEDPDRIIARLIADAVAGLDPVDPRYPDLIPGAILHDVYGSVSLELDREYDRIHVELPASAFPTTATGEWLDAWAEALGLERKDEVRALGSVRFTSDVDAGTPEVDIPAGTQASTEATSSEAEEIVFVTLADALIPAGGGQVDVDVEAYLAGAAGNVPANTVTFLQSDVNDVASVTNPEAMTTGTDVETDEALQYRVGRKLASAGGAGNIADYENWGLEEPGVGFVTVEPNWAGAGTVRSFLTDANNDPVGNPLLDAHKARVDPNDGDGFGLAPIGAVVTVATPGVTGTAVEAVLVFDPGFSLDGAGGTRALREEITEALRRYINRLRVGEDVIRAKVIAAIVNVDGVANVNLVAPAADVAIAAAMVAALTEPPNLTE